MTIRSRSLLLVLGAAAVAVAAFLLARLAAPTPTDEERIRALLRASAAAVEERRIGEAMEAVSERFRAGDLDRQGLRAFVAFHAMRGEWVRVGVASDRIAVRGDAADATVDVVLARSGAGRALADLLPAEASAWRIACVLAREDAGWRVTSATWHPVALADALAGPADAPR